MLFCVGLVTGGTLFGLGSKILNKWILNFFIKLLRMILNLLIKLKHKMNCDKKWVILKMVKKITLTIRLSAQLDNKVKIESSQMKNKVLLRLLKDYATKSTRYKNKKWSFPIKLNYDW